MRASELAAVAAASVATICPLFVADALMYDVVSPSLVAPANCPHGCAEWASTLNITHQWWQHGSPPTNASNHCAQLANATGLNDPSPLLDPAGIGAQGAWCICADPAVTSKNGQKKGAAAAAAASGMMSASESWTWGYCTSPSYVPEQINLQLAASDTVVVSFVTFEPVAPAGLPVAELQVVEAANATQQLEGVTHTYVSPSGNRTYYMHFVKFAGLVPRTRYRYRVRSGAPDAVWSEPSEFRSPYDSGDGLPTRVAIFGDMGVYSWNNMQNLKDDVEANLIDAVVHMGDHCYNIGGEDDRRGDGYMQAYEPVLAEVPWIPIVGNHEFYDGDELRRYLNQTEGTVIASNSASASHPWLLNAGSTADSALGSLLSAGNHHGAGLHGTTPSGTSRYYSTDLGLVHFVALDLNMYNGVDTCGEPCRQAQLQWLERDLVAATANRDKVPWIVAMSHFPLYCSNCPAPGHDPPANQTRAEAMAARAERRGLGGSGTAAADDDAAAAGAAAVAGQPGAWYASEACEFTGHDPTCTLQDAAFRATQQRLMRNPLAAGNDDMVPDFEPLFMKYGVDVYSSGHIHDFEWIYPVYNNTAVQKDFVDPQAPVHLITGNGGPPSASVFKTIHDWSHLHSSTYSYTRLTVFNSTTMLWVQVANDANSTVLAELYVTQSKHGPFPLPPAAAVV